MAKILQIVFLYLCFCCVCALSAQPGFEYVLRLHEDNGLPDNTVREIVQDKEGFIWIGMDEGLARYDGAQFVLLKNEPADSTTIPDNRVRALLPVGDRLWIGTPTGLAVMDLNTEKFSRKDLDRGNKYRINGQTKVKIASEEDLSQYVLALTQSRDGTLWVVTDQRGICKYRPETDEFICYTLDPEAVPEYAASRDKVSRNFRVIQDVENDSILWIGSFVGLIRFNMFSTEMTHYYFSHDDPGFQTSFNVFRRLWQDRDRKIYCGSWHGGLRVFDPLEETYRQAPFQMEGVEDFFFQPIRSIRRKSEHEIWIAYLKGLAVYDLKKQDFTDWLENDLDEDLVYGVDFIDKDQRIWVASNGLHIYDPKLQQFQYASFKHLNPRGLQGYAYHVIWDDVRKRYTVLARDSKSLFHYDPAKDGWSKSPIPPSFFYRGRFSANNAVPLDQDRYLISTIEKLFIYDAAKDKFAPFPIELPVDFNFFKKVLLDRKNRLWIGTSQDGLLCWNRKNGKIQKYHSEFQSNPTQKEAQPVFEDSRGNVWIFRAPHLFIYLDAQDTIIQIPDKAKNLSKFADIQEDRMGRIWVGTHTGLVHLIEASNPQKGAVRTIGVGGNFNSLYALLKDKDGQIWCFTAEGAVKIDVESLEQTAYYNAYAIDNSNVFSFNSFKNGQFVIGSRNEITVIDPAALQFNTELPRPYLTNIKVKEEEYLAKLTPRKINRLRLKPDENFFSLSFSSLGYTLSDEITFRYRLAPFDKEWIDAKERRFANYTNVPSGDYVFELQAANSEGDWNPEPQKLAVHIDRYWWNLPWVQILGGLLLLAAIYGAYRYQLSQVRREERLEAAFQKRLAGVEMSALRAQMNPHFIFNCLSSIENYVIKNDTVKAASYLNDFARLIRLILQNSRSKYVVLEDELEALQLYMEMESLRFINNFDYQIHLCGNVDPGNIEIPPMLIQPYVENAIWHGLMHNKAQRGKIDISISQKNGLLYCNIEDNGVGRKKSSEINARRSIAKKKSMGMQITQDRIKMLNELYNTHTKLEIRDLKDEDGRALGTRVELQIPI